MMLGTNFSGEYRGAGNVLDSGAVTLAAANTTAGAAGTIKLVNGFVNPANATDTSNRWISIIRVVVATVSGTPAGPFFWNFQTLPNGVTCSSASTGTVRNTKVGSGASTAVTPLVNVVVTRSDAGVGAFSQLATIGGPTAVAATGAVETVQEETRGILIVPPGTIFGIAASGAGTTHIVQSTIYWEELARDPA